MNVFTRLRLAGISAGLIAVIAASGAFAHNDAASDCDSTTGRAIERHAHEMLSEGKKTFRYDTFGDESWWGGTLGLHQAIEGADLGGVGSGISPKTALAVGLKVDIDALPPRLPTAKMRPYSFLPHSDSPA